MAGTTFPWLSIGLILAVGPDWESTAYSLSPTKIHLQVECGRPAAQRAPTPQEGAKRSEMWWRGDVARIAFGIDKRRSKELEVIFQQTLPMLKTLRADVARKEAMLSRLLENASTTNESVVVKAVEDLEVSRRSLARTFTMMHYHMYLRLTSAQRKKVHEYLYQHAEPSAKGAAARSYRVAPMTVPGSMVGVVDDEPSVRRALDRLLRAYGFRVQAFASADEFLERAANAERPACLIVDVRMAGKTGLDLVDVLRARGTDIPTIMMTGHREAWMTERAGKAGVVEFLAKPVDSDVLLEAIARALGP